MYEKIKISKGVIIFAIISIVVLVVGFYFGVIKHTVSYNTNETVTSATKKVEETTVENVSETTTINPSESTSVTTTETTSEVTTVVQVDDTPGHIEVPNLVPAGSQSQNNDTDTLEGDVLLAEPPAEATTDGICTLSVSCDTILNNMDKLDKAKKSLVPSDGVIFKAQKIGFKAGDTVYDVLEKALVVNNIQFEYNKTTNVYIEGINNLYEFDCGKLSGWMYKVNGVFPNKGCDAYTLSDGDVVEWVYTCDLGRDVGEQYMGDKW